MGFKEKVFTKELEKYGLSLLEDPDYNTTGAIRMLAVIRDKSLEEKLEKANDIVRLCAEGAWMAQRMLVKINQYNPAYRDCTNFDKKYHSLSFNAHGYRTICHVVSLIGEAEETLLDLCLKTLKITKAYHYELSRHNSKYDDRSGKVDNLGTEFSSSVWEKDPK